MFGCLVFLNTVMVAWQVILHYISYLYIVTMILDGKAPNKRKKETLLAKENHIDTNKYSYICIIIDLEPALGVITKWYSRFSPGPKICQFCMKTHNFYCFI